MNIGIDIDGVLTNYERERLDYGTKICIDEGWPVDIDLGQYHEKETFNWNQEQADKFWNKYIIKYFKETPVRTFAPEVIEKLKQEGHKIILITARDDYGMPTEHLGEEQHITKEWLKRNNIKYDKIIFETKKLEPCKENQIDVMIEDSPKNIEELSKHMKVIKFDCQYNKSVNNENITTAYSWYHIYKIINEMKLA